MARIMIWPDLYKEHGHWLPCINLANTLRTASTPHQVDFMGIPDCQSIVEPYLVNSTTQFHPIFGTIYPSGYSTENKLEPKGQRWKPAHLLPMCRLEGGVHELFQDTNPNRPQLLISGYFNALETLMIHHRYGVPIVTITTYLRHPSDDPAMHAMTKLVYMSRVMSQKIIDSVNQTGQPMSFDQFVKPLEDAPEIIPCPRAFDYTDEDWYHRENVSYVEPMIRRVKLDGSNQPPNPLSDPPQGAKVIFGTSGSQVQDYQSRAREFFTNLIAMMQTPEMGGYTLVLAVGDQLLPQLKIQYGVDTGNSTLPANVKLHAWVSQLDVMSDATAIFMHGGLATIKEAIYENVPIVIVPHGKDQLDNALRLQRLGLGIVAQMQDTSPTNLRKLLTEATSSTWLKQNIANMRSVFMAADAAKTSLPIIETALGI